MRPGKGKLGFVLLCMVATLSCLAGCSESASSPISTAVPTQLPTGVIGTISTPTGTPVAVPKTSNVALGNGWTEYRNEAEGFSIQLPSKWVILDASKETLDAKIAELQALSPESAKQLQQIAPGLHQAVKLWGFDYSEEATASGYNPNVQITRVPRPVRASLDAIANLQIAGIKKQMGNFLAGEINYKQVTLPAGEAAHLSFAVTYPGTDGLPYEIANNQYLVLSEEYMYGLTFDTSVAQAVEQSALYEQIAQSFKLLK